MELNAEEIQVIKHIAAAGKYENIIFDLSYFIPCAFFIVVGISRNYIALTYIGIAVLFSFYLYAAIRQAKSLQTLKKIANKLLQEGNANNKN